jgi:hypothetical protein
MVPAAAGPPHRGEESPPTHLAVGEDGRRVANERRVQQLRHPHAGEQAALRGVWSEARVELEPPGERGATGSRRAHGERARIRLHLRAVPIFKSVMGLNNGSTPPTETSTGRACTHTLHHHAAQLAPRALSALRSPLPRPHSMKPTACGSRVGREYLNTLMVACCQLRLAGRADSHHHLDVAARCRARCCGLLARRRVPLALALAARLGVVALLLGWWTLRGVLVVG